MKYEQTAELLLDHMEVPEFGWLTRRQANRVVAQVLEAMAQVVEDLPMGGCLSLQGFGKFYWKERPERTHWNRNTKQVELIPAKVALVFKPAKLMKRVVKKDGVQQDPRTDSRRGASRSDT
jgi:nucleoid DNA-binding protein